MAALLNILSARIYSSLGLCEPKKIKELVGFFLLFVQSNKIH